MASLSTIRDNIKTAITDGVSGLEVYDIVPGNITPPCAIIYPQSAEYLQRMGGSTVTTWAIDVVIIVARNDEEGAQDALDAYLSSSGASSVIAAIQADDTLSDSVAWAKPVTISRYGEFVYNGVSYIGAQIDLEVSE